MRGRARKALLGKRINQWIDSQGYSLLFETTIATNQIEPLISLSFFLPFSIHVVLAIGGGKVIDCSQYLAHLLQKPLIVFPTSVSNDRFYSLTSSLVVVNKHPSIKSILPDALILDLDVLASYLDHLLFAGVSDLFCQ